MTLKPSFYNKKYDFYDVTRHVKTLGATSIVVPPGYKYKKEIVSGAGKLNVYYYDKGETDCFRIQTGKKETVAYRIITPSSLSKYLRFHDRDVPSAYDIEYKNGQLTVKKQELENA